MPQLEYFVVSESASIDQLTNRVSIFNIYDQITINKFPYHIPQLVAVCSWNVNEEDLEKDFQISMLLHTPDEKKGPFKNNITMKRPRHRSIFSLHGIELKKEGIIKVEIMLDSKKIASHTIDILSVENQ